MPVEYERKYVVDPRGWQHLIDSSCEITQGYIAHDSLVEIRVRQQDDEGVLTIKSRDNVDEIGRLEYEYVIPVSEASELLQRLTTSVLCKTRFSLVCGPGRWTIDLFHGDNAGLVLLEVEADVSFALDHLPNWVQREATHDPRYKNSYLAVNPYRTWG